MENLLIRTATTEDAEALSRIYAYYVEKTAASFEYTPPTPAVMAQRLADFTQKYPYLVIEEENHILGFAYAHALIDRPACDYAAELTIYLHETARHKGCGRALYTALENELAQMGVTKLYACIATADDPDEYLSADSPRFHEAMGYRQCGEFSRCGYKFGHWYNLIWMHKETSDIGAAPDPITAYPEILRRVHPANCKSLFDYHEKRIRLVTGHGELFIGEASHFPAEYGMHEFGVEEEGLQIGMYLCFQSDIANVEII